MLSGYHEISFEAGNFVGDYRTSTYETLQTNHNQNKKRYF